LPQAQHYFTQAVQRYDIPRAQYYMGYFNENGTDNYYKVTPEALVKAREHYEKAAKPGYMEAQYRLGVFYENERGG
jgi:TPR repeat protein